MQNLNEGTRVTITEMNISGTVIESNAMSVIVETDNGMTVTVSPNQVSVQKFLREG
jgi:mRNA degradation ribonuclease J1/J2